MRENHRVSMGEGNPLVTVIVRTKDRPKLLKRALQSIAVQTYRPIEAVVVNDGGCDLDVEGLRNILGEVSLNYVRLEENRGRSQAGNVGIDHARGDYIGFLDDDDELYPEHLSTLVSLLAHIDYKVAYTDSMMVYKEYSSDILDLVDVDREVAFSRDYDYDFLVFENYIPFMCLLFTREVLVDAGGFDADFTLYEDWDLLIRLGELYPFYHIRKITANYNQWDNDLQISQRNRDCSFIEQSYQRVLSKHIEKITEKRVRSYISHFVRARNALKDLRTKSDYLENTLAKEAEKIMSSEHMIGNVEAGIRDKATMIGNLRAAIREEASGGKLEAIVRLKDAAIGHLDAVIRNKDSYVQMIEAMLRDKDATIGNLNAAMKDKDADTEHLNAVLRDRDSALKDKDAFVEKLETALRDKDEDIERLEAAVSEKDASLGLLESAVRGLRDKEVTLNSIYNSNGWKALLIYYRIRDRILPPNSRRRLFVKLLTTTVANPRGLLKNLTGENFRKFFIQYRILEPSILESKVKRKTSFSFDDRKVTCAPPPDEVRFDSDPGLLSLPAEKNHILVIDRFLPTYDKDSGSLRMYSLLGILSELGYRVIFLPDDLQKMEPYASDLQTMGVEVLHGNVNVEKYLERMGPVFSFVIISRPEQMFKYISLVRAYAINSTVIYDTVDLHWVRFERAVSATGDVESLKKAREFKRMELLNASCSDVVFAITDEEKAILRKEIPGLEVEVMPNIHEVVRTKTPVADRRDVMFIGGFLHQPNEDAVFYFVKEIFPLIKEKIRDMRFFVVGSDPSPALLHLNSEDIVVTGYVRDVTPYFERCRVFVSPLRYGAGMKGKIGQSMASGLPVVTTTVGAEGIGLVGGETALIADEPGAFAEAVIRLYTDEALWNSISQRSMEHIEKNYSREAVSKKVETLFESLKQQEHRDVVFEAKLSGAIV